MSKELAALNGKLSNQSYVSGCVPSKDDASAFKEMFGNNTAVMQWAARMASYYQSERDEIAKTAPAKKAAEPKKADKKADKKAEKKHADPAPAPAAAKKEAIPDGPVTAGPLIVNFKKFAADKSAYFMNINLEYTNDTMAYIAGPEGFEPREILTMLTDKDNCEKYVATYIKVAKTKESKQDKVKEEISKLVEDFMSPKVGGCKNLQAVAEKKAVEVDPETAELIAEFSKFIEGKGTHTKPAMWKAVLEYLPEGFHKADIKSMLTVGDDCDELLETYIRLAVVPGNDKLRVRTEIVNFVEGFAESKGIVQEDCFSF